MPPDGRFPARLHGLLASAAPVGVVLRRGPANAVCSVLWDRENDRFQLGQWVRARIYERRADLSPDGRYLIYFARSARWQSETRGSYTAISRAPYLKAIVLLGKGDCWQGGGLFTSERRYWVNGGCCHFPIQDSDEIRPDPGFKPAALYGGECPGVYYLRLQRDGWRLVLQADTTRLNECTVFEKVLPHGWILRKYAHAQVRPPKGKGCYWDDHELEHPGLRRIIPCPEWEWAELDGATLVWAEAGRLHRAPLDGGGPGEPRVIHDFNSMEFEARKAPY